MKKIDQVALKTPISPRWSTFLVLAAAALWAARADAEPGVPTAARAVVLLCKFSDRATEPRTVASYGQLFTSAGAGTGGFYDYWRDQSYGASDFGSTAVRGWYTMSVTEATYNSWGFDRPRKARACIDAATDVDFTAYRSIIVVTNTAGDYTGFIQELTFGGVTRPYGVTILWGGLDVSAAVQEIAHGYNLQHSWSTTSPGVSNPLYETEYGDQYDVMSAANVFGYTSPVYRFTSGPGFNGPHREWLGWLPASRVTTFGMAPCASSCSRTFSLADMNTPTASGALLLKVPTDRPGHYFTVEYRRRIGWDQGMPNDAVFIHEVRTNGLAYLVRTSPRGNGEWFPGETFTVTSPTALSVSIGSAIPGGSISVTVTRSVSAADWIWIRGVAGDLVPGGMSLVVTEPGGGNLVRYDGVPGSWSTIGGPGAQFAGNNRWLFALDTSRSRVYRYDGRWTAIGDAATSLIAGGESLYTIEPGTGDIWRFDGIPYVWTRVGGPGAAFVVNDVGLFALNPGCTAVMRYTGTPGVWEQIGNAATKLIVTSTDLFALQPASGNIWRYNGTPFSWTQVGGPGAQFVGNGGTLYGLTSNRQAVMRFTGSPGVWEQVGGPASRIASTGTHLYATSPGEDAVFMFTR